MKRCFLLAIISCLLISCSGSSVSQPATWTPEAPKKINITIELPTATSDPTSTATDEATFTPVPPSITLTASCTSTPTITSTARATATRPLPTRTLKPTAIIIPTNPPIIIEPTNPPTGACCKHCTPGKSKACGDSCISITKSCHTTGGCACNG
jgi:hypothetical protein